MTQGNVQRYPFRAEICKTLFATFAGVHATGVQTVLVSNIPR